MKDSLEEIATDIRRTSVILSAKTKSSHLGCSLSMADILAYLYSSRINPDIDKFILSKGHAAIGLYSTLNVCGLMDDETLATYMQNGTQLIEHPNHAVDNVDVSTGSLGHGVAIGTGLAFAKKRKKENGHIFCLVGDGECQEGTVWESLIVSARLGLDNLTIIVDYNNLQGYSDTTNSLLAKENLRDMLRGAGLQVIEIDGHDFNQIKSSISEAQNGTKIILATTLKGKGVSFMENKFEWHYKNPDEKQLQMALDELK